MNGTRVQGKVKWFNAKKGYGFIDRNSLSPVPDQDVFIHNNYLPQDVTTLAEGQAVSFTVEETRKGLRATALTVD